MQVIFLVFVFTLFGGAFPAPSREWYKSTSYSDLDDEFPFGYTGAFANSGAAGAYARFWPYTGYPFFNPFWPFGWRHIFTPTIPWYKGKNVCREEKTVDMPDDVLPWLIQSKDSKRQSTFCHGNNTVYTCEKRQGSEMLLTTYACCPGYVLSNDGCDQESADGNATPAGAPTPVRKEHPSSSGDQYSYNQYRNQYISSDSNSDTTRGSDVEKVAPQ